MPSIFENRPAAAAQLLDFTSSDVVNTRRHGRINLDTAKRERAARDTEVDPGARVDRNVSVSSNAIRASEKAQKALIHAMRTNPTTTIKGGVEQPLIKSHSQLKISAYLASAGRPLITRADAVLMDRGLGGDDKSYIIAEYGAVDPGVYTDANADALLGVAERAMARLDDIEAKQVRRNRLVTIVDRAYSDQRQE